MIEEIYQCKRLFGDDVWRTKEGIARTMNERPGLIIREDKIHRDLFADPYTNWLWKYGAS